jgi:Tol biopolymer transport system component/DNA-binding winged helix-turn-helix (wHTH) protein
MSLPTNHFYRFGEFTVDTDQKVLLREDQPVHLTPKVFDTLLVLLENHRRIVEKEELMKRLWPDTFVEETNLTFNIQQLRKALGDRAQQPVYIETVARRGYRFIADLEEGPGLTNGQRQQGIETSALQAPTTEIELKGELAAPPAEPAARLAVARSISKKSGALAVAAIIVLVGAGLGYWKFSNSLNNKIDGQAKLAVPLKLEKLTGTGQSRQVAISPDGKYIAYTRLLKGEASVWLRQLATNTNVEIVPPGSPVYGLAFTQSGEYLYFVRSEPRALYRVSPLGGVPTKIIEKLEGSFSISADDRQIAFIRMGPNRDGLRDYALMIANVDGTGERALLVVTHPDGLSIPVWSGDGGAIICTYGNSDGGSQTVSLVEVRIADGVKKELSPDRFFHIWKLAWLPDRSALIMAGRKNLAHNNQLWRVSYPGGQISQITEDLNDYIDLSIAAQADKAVASHSTHISDIWVGSSSEPRNLKKITNALGAFGWTPNGQLVYTSTASGNQDLWIMQPDGTEQRQLTNAPLVDVQPAVTPDNRYIVFGSNRTGSAQIWRMDQDGGNQIQLTHGGAKGYAAISPDGKWVLYNTTDDWHLWKVSIDGGEPVRLTDFVAVWPAVSPDGAMIACVRRAATKREIMLLPFAGGQPLRSFDAAEVRDRLQWTADGKALIYISGLGGVMALKKQSLTGGAPAEILDFGEDKLFDFGYSFDSQKLAVTRGNWQHDLVLISELK